MLNRLYGWYGKRVVRIVLGVLVILVIVGMFSLFGGSDEDSTEELNKLPVVTVQSVASLGGTSNFSVVGTVRAVSEAKLQAETGGRITSVSVKVGDFVPAGKVLGSVENSREQAQLLQAEGAYESALVSSVQGDVSLDEAKVSVRNTYRDTFSIADTVVHNVIDQFFSNPESGIPGVRLSGTGGATEFIAIRKSIGDDLKKWSDELAQPSGTMTEEAMIEDAEETVTAISNFTSRFAAILADEKDNIYLTDSERKAYQAEFANARGSMDGALGSISNARNAYEQAKLSAASGSVSQSSALLKSAEGSLRNAQVSYEKTLVRTPISGVVNVLNLTVGENISQGQLAVIVANNGALEVSTALGEEDLTRIKIGGTVIINNSATGTITQIAPAIDPTTGKSEVKISIDDSVTLKNGSTVTVAFSQGAETENATQNKEITVPLKALKMLASGPVAFGVNEQNTLVSYPVVLGTVFGDSVLVTEGLTLETEIISDARGLKEGDTVEVARN